MLFFYNPGLIEPDTIRTMGVSVKLPNAFGMFGTGLKYAIATILRGGGSITLYRGAEQHNFTTESRPIRGVDFDFVLFDGEPIGFTTALGKNWKAWMVLRELGCNARDEGGDFAAAIEGRKLADFQSVDQTVFVVDWKDLDDAYNQRGDLFLEGEPIFESDKLRILPGPSPHLFYRGVRVFKLEKPAAYSYDILEEQMLTEDRTLLGQWSADSIIRDALLALDDKTTLETALVAGGNYYEDKLDFTSTWAVTPSRAFIDTVVEAREAGAPGLNASARKVLQKHMRKVAEEEYVGGGGYRRIVSDAFGYAIDVLDELGVKFDDEQAFIHVEELPNGVLSYVESGRIYFLNRMLDMTAREIALELLKRYVDLQPDTYTAEQVVALLGPLLIDQHSGMKRAARLIEEDEAPVEEPDVLELTEPVA